MYIYIYIYICIYLFAYLSFLFISDLYLIFIFICIFCDLLANIIYVLYSDILSGNLSGTYSDILSGIYADSLSGILPGTFSVLLCHHSIWHLFWRPFSDIGTAHGGHWDLQPAVEVWQYPLSSTIVVRQRTPRSGARGWRGRGEGRGGRPDTPLIKSRGPHLAGREILHVYL